ncbi:glycosyltransferase family 2 protein [Flammeovirga sp. SJP92]|uniref:glycosyltransferase family 2 protein n=1 Tax=Flammeovirga sp. SJP92 TaxID=1775430 RepID=UPI000787342B|nr:glycosyltransferase family 2 protein [Flammeovirga sp. SJP92]KXX72603.1 glycosyltransferase [Flammeovirga sp. SJP92]
MKISIITIVYNNASYISDCINSVISQDYDNIEYIVIDGGSNDGTQEVIKKYSENIDFFISEKDKGLYNALNKGLKLCTGDIIGILHSDDIFYSKSIIRDIVGIFQTQKNDLLYGNGMYVERDNPTKVKRIYKSNKFSSRYLAFGWIPLHTTIFVKKEMIHNFGLYNENYKIASDYDISLRWFKSNCNKYYLNKWIVKMRLGGKSTTMQLQKEKSREDLEIINKHQLFGRITLYCKIIQKIPQYILPYFFKYDN